MTKTRLAENFRNRFHREPEHYFFCPGRVNLIGEHIDYNGGEVMPCAISRGTWLAIAKNVDKKLRFECGNFSETADFHLQSSYSRAGKEWFNYPLGSINQLLHEGHLISGLDMFYFGDLPIGAGLSSSASIEVLTMFAASELFGMNIPKIEIARLGKKVENEFIGVNSGIMDQFAVAMGKKDKAILLNCDTLAYEYIPFDTGNFVLAIINSNKPRTLADSKYNERFAQCGQVLKLLKQEVDAVHLCDIDNATFEQHLHLLNDPVLEKRARHVVTENERVKKARHALLNGQLATFGRLMYDSHASLQNLYEVSGPELDTIVDFCKSYHACIGARMTGAGFGGCAIAMVEEASFEDFAKELTLDYKKRIGYEPELFASVIDDGVREL